MEEVDKYRQVVREIIQKYAARKPARGDIQIEVIFDEAQDHYELIQSGWNESFRINGSVLHVDIRNGKVWIQHDGTEDGIAEELVLKGIPRDHIVLAFRPPELRSFTDYAVA